MTSGVSAQATSGLPRELVSIQYLRGVAALGVVVWHAQGQVGLPNTAVLQAGIEIFFVISGYVLWLILGERPVPPLTFIKKRLIRVVPLYWVLTTAMVGLMLVAPQLLQSARLDPAHVIASYLFIGWPNPVEGVGLKPVMIPGWTLNYEMAFYLLLTIALFLKASWRGPFVIGSLCLLAGLSRVSTPTVLSFYLSPFMAEIALGVGLAMVLPRLPGQWARGGGAIFGLGLGLLVVGGALIDDQADGRLVLLALPAVLVVAGLVGIEQSGHLPGIPVLKAIGDASYPLYMMHPVVLSAMSQGLRGAQIEMPPWLYVIAGLVVTSVIGWIAHLTLERPLIAAFRPRATAARPSQPALLIAKQKIDA